VIGPESAGGSDIWSFSSLDDGRVGSL
jgi:hypothetical protein